MTGPRSHLVYDAETAGLVGEMDDRDFARFLVVKLRLRGRRGVPGDEFGFPGIKISVPDAREHDPWAWDYDAVAVVLSADGSVCIRPPTYDKRFVRRLKALSSGAGWSDGTGELPKGWWVAQEDVEGVLQLLPRFFHGLPIKLWMAHGQCLGTRTLEYPGPWPKEYERPEAGCEPLRAYLTLPELRVLSNASALVLHKPVGVTSDDFNHIDLDSEDFWLSGYGYDLASCYGRLGEPRWINECFGAVEGAHGVEGIAYRADHEHGEPPPRVPRWRKREEMERDQARFVVALDYAAILRLQDLPPEDHGGDLEQFAQDWNRRQYGRVFPWATNPWVWRLRLRRILPPPG